MIHGGVVLQLRFFRFLLWASLVFSYVPVMAQSDNTAEQMVEIEAAAQRQQIRGQLAEIQQSIASRREELTNLQASLEAATEDERSEITARIAQLSQAIAELNESFEQILIGGLDVNAFEGEDEQQPFDWRAELEQITRPLLNSLKDLTEKPRRIEALRANIQIFQEQQALAEQALTALDGFNAAAFEEGARQRYEAVRAKWQERVDDAERSLEVARIQLANLQGQNVSWQESLRTSLSTFTEGRGLTLALGIAVAVAVWLVLKLVLKVIQTLGRHVDRQHTMRVRLLIYGFRVATTLLIILAVLIVFYVRGDLLLTALVIIALATLALSLRQTVPRYLAEVRLLLGIGPVRYGERLIYNGLPMRVRSVNMHSILHNPELSGIIRIPLLALNNYHSRPYHEDEPWFPCRPGDYVVLPDGGFGLVEQQTLETVQLRMMNSPVLFSSADFWAMPIRNLSREGFGVAATFGIDYRHQGICLDEVPQRFEGAIRDALNNHDLGQYMTGLLVDFKEAGANSLDYLVYISFSGAAAGSYYSVGRLVQRTCVAVCNHENWGIPFAQLTLHQGEGFAALQQPIPSSGTVG